MSFRGMFGAKIVCVGRDYLKYVSSMAYCCSTGSIEEKFVFLRFLYSLWFSLGVGGFSVYFCIFAGMLFSLGIRIPHSLFLRRFLFRR